MRSTPQKDGAVGAVLAGNTAPDLVITLPEETPQPQRAVPTRKEVVVKVDRQMGPPCRRMHSARISSGCRR